MIYNLLGIILGVIVAVIDFQEINNHATHSWWFYLLDFLFPAYLIIANTWKLIKAGKEQAGIKKYLANQVPSEPEDHQEG